LPQISQAQLAPVFVGVWGVLCLFSACFFFLSKNATLKRKVWPPFSVAAAILFVGFAWAMDAPPQMFVIIIPAVALVTLLNLRAMKFCDACGKTTMSQNLMSPPQFCSKCGARFEQ
jgi:hypothetical protein